MAKSTSKVVVHKSAKTGQFVKPSYAKSLKATTYKTTVKK